MDARYRAAARPSPALRHCTRTLRTLAVLVLAGLWLMHGDSATTEAGCHGVPVMMPMSASADSPGSQAAASARPGAMRADTRGSGAASGVRAQGAASEHPGPCESCLSGQPPSPHDLSRGLLSPLALLGLAVGMGAQPAQPLMRFRGRARRRGPPGPVGRTLLTTVCVSRT